MKRGYTEEQIIRFLKEHESGRPATKGVGGESDIGQESAERHNIKSS